MKEVLIGAGILAFFVILSVWVLPRLGISG
jgi:hypothetical protein